MSLARLHSVLRETCSSLLHTQVTCPAAPSAALRWLPAPHQQLTSLLSLVLRSGAPTSGFATEAAAAAGAEAQVPVHPSAALHARRAWQKPQNSNRNAYRRAEKKQLQIRVNARTRKKQQAAANAARDAERTAKWRAGAALWRSGKEETGQDAQQG